MIDLSMIESAEAAEMDMISIEAVEVEEIALREERAGWCLCSYND